MTDKLREALATLSNKNYQYESFNTEINGRLHVVRGETEFVRKSEVERLLTVIGDDVRAALAAAPQPAPEEGLTRAQVGAMLDAKRHDREALVEVIREAWQSHEAALRAVLAERDALQGQLNDLRNGWANSVKAHADALAERDALRAAIFGGTDYATDMTNGNFIEMEQTTEAARLGALDRAEKAEAERDAAFAAGQESMRERSLAEIDLMREDCHPPRTPLVAAVPIWLDVAALRIRQLPIKPRPE